MQFARVALISVLAALASAQSPADIPGLVAQLPACALTCLTPAISASGCAITDYTCQCTTGRDALLSSAGPCIVSGCNSADATKTTTLTDEICAAAAGGSSSSSAVSSAASSVSSAASSASSAASSLSSAASSLSSALSSASSASSGSSASSASSTASSATSSKASSASSAATSASSAASSAKPSATGNVANTLHVGAGVLGAAILAAVAL